MKSKDDANLEDEKGEKGEMGEEEGFDDPPAQRTNGQNAASLQEKKSLVIEISSDDEEEKQLTHAGEGSLLDDMYDPLAH